MTILTPDNATPRCTCTVDMLSAYFRPFNFIVTVTGEPPHACVRRYKVVAPTDDEAAMFAMQMFTKEFMPKIVTDGMAPIAPKATLQ